MQEGNHLLVDCHHVARETCLNDKLFLEVMARSAERAGATIISQFRYRFGQDSPAGFTAVVMLDESHCSAHSYADQGLLALDIFTCGHTVPRQLLSFIRDEINLGTTVVRDVTRFAALQPDIDATKQLIYSEKG